MSDVTGYLDYKNIGYKIQGNEAVTHCPTCGKEKLYININTGVYHCFVCEAENPDEFTAKGHLNQLKSYYGDIVDIDTISHKIKKIEKKEELDFTDQAKRYEYELWTDAGKKGLKYLLKRGLTEETIKRAGLGFTRRYNQNWVSIPVAEGEIVKLIKYRKVPPYEEECEIKEKAIREKDGKSILYNNKALKKYKEVILAEGEIDALMLLQNGYENVVGLTVGAGTMKPEWYDELILKDKIYLCLDSDAAGQQAARNVWAERLGKGKCYNVELPEGMDVNDFFLKHTKEDFDLLLKKATTFKIDGVKSLDEVFLEMYRLSTDPERDLFLETPWPSLNRKLEKKQGFAKGRLLVLSGRAKAGKTSMTLQMCYHFIKKYKAPCLYICLEMPEVDLATKLVQIHYEMSYEEVSFADALVYATDMADMPLYFGYAPNITPEIYYNTAKAVRDRFGIEVIVFDNLQLMIRTGKEEDIGKASKMFQMASRNLGIFQILVSQPRKINNDDRAPVADDLKGSSAIQQDADYVIFVDRKKMKDGEDDSSFSAEAHVRVEMSRYSSGGSTKLLFLGDYSKFVELEG